MQEDVFHEIHERQKRAQNVMLYNMPENNRDLEEASAVITKLLADPVPLSGVLRMGRRNKNGCRPLRASLPSQAAAQGVLRGRAALKGTNIFVGADLT